MAQLNCTEILERDSNGEVVRAGAHWNEQSNFPDGLRKFLRYSGIALVLFSIWIMFYASLVSAGRPSADGNFVASMIAFVLGGPGLVMVLANLKGQPRRSVIFHRDGRVESPFGIVSDKAARIWGASWSHPSIKLIEAVGLEGITEAATWSVAFVYEKGDTIKVSDCLYRDEARKVVVMLKRAWDALHPGQSPPL